MRLERAAAWVAAYLLVGLALYHADLVGPPAGGIAAPLWLPTALALALAGTLRAATAPALAGDVARWAVVYVALALQGAALVAGWGLVRAAGARLPSRLGNP